MQLSFEFRRLCDYLLINNRRNIIERIIYLFYHRLFITARLLRNLLYITRNVE